MTPTPSNHRKRPLTFLEAGEVHEAGEVRKTGEVRRVGEVRKAGEVCGELVDDSMDFQMTG